MDSGKAFFFGVTASACVVPLVYRLAIKKESRSRSIRSKENLVSRYRSERSGYKKPLETNLKSKQSQSSLRNEVAFNEEKHVHFAVETDSEEENQHEPQTRQLDTSDEQPPGIIKKSSLPAQIVENRQKSSDNALKLALHNATLNRLLEEHKSETKVLLSSQAQEILDLKQNMDGVLHELHHAKDMISELSEQQQIDSELKIVLQTQAMRKSILAGLATRKAQEQSKLNTLLRSELDSSNNRIQELESRLESSLKNPKPISKDKMKLELTCLNEATLGAQEIQKIPYSEFLDETIHKIQSESKLLQSSFSDLEAPSPKEELHSISLNKFLRTFKSKKFGTKKSKKFNLT